jgi:hypothetical protein
VGRCGPRRRNLEISRLRKKETEHNGHYSACKLTSGSADGPAWSITSYACILVCALVQRDHAPLEIKIASEENAGETTRAASSRNESDEQLRWCRHRKYVQAHDVDTCSPAPSPEPGRAAGGRRWPTRPRRRRRRFSITLFSDQFWGKWK